MQSCTPNQKLLFKSPYCRRTQGKTKLLHPKESIVGERVIPKGQRDLMVLNYHKDYNGLRIEFKSPTNNYQISDAQREMKKRYKEIATNSS